MTKIIKEIIIILLICLATMLALAIALYQYIPNRKVVPEITQYKASEETQELLEDDIDTRTGKNDDNKAVLTLTSTDLNNYRKSYDYVPGKSNPFATYTKTIEGDPEQNQTRNKHCF